MDTPALKPPELESTQRTEPAKRRYSGPPVAEIAAGGDVDETFWVRLTMTFDDYAALETERRRLGIGEDQDLVAYVSLMMYMAGRMLEHWTLQYPDGTPIPCTEAEFRKLDTEMISPVVERVSDFLGKRTRGRVSPTASA